MTIIILANAAAVFAFLFGATSDFSALIPRSERLNRLSAIAMAVTLGMCVHFVIRLSK